MGELNYIAILKGPTVLRGEEARQALALANDAEFYVSGEGIPRVSRSRWEIAQQAEGTHWFGDGSKPPLTGDDRNIVHFSRFDGYRAIQDLKFNSAIEFGSGPFTNLRLIAKVVSDIGQVTLLDPGLDVYMNHPGRYFNKYSLARVSPSYLMARLWPLIPRKLKDFRLSIRKRSIPIGALVSHAAEGFDGHHKFDLVVMVNVLEHCMDSSRVLDAVFSSLAPGGILILSEKTHLDESVRIGLLNIYDVAHPIRVTKKAIEERLDGFEILFHASHEDPVSLYLPGTEESYWIAKRLR